jgi:predicted O-methyltransferase YrrM
VRAAPNPAHFVEIGSWKGRSAAFMAVEIANSGKRIRFDCVDTWLGSQEKKHLEDPSVKNGTLFDEFCRNTRPVKERINVVRLPSVEAAALYPDRSLDFIFIDAAHDYENVRADIGVWWPKLKPGGWMAGDDYRGSGVKKAVDHMFSWNVESVPGTGAGCAWRVKKYDRFTRVQGGEER